MILVYLYTTGYWTSDMDLLDKYVHNSWVVCIYNGEPHTQLECQTVLLIQERWVIRGQPNPQGGKGRLGVVWNENSVCRHSDIQESRDDRSKVIKPLPEKCNFPGKLKALQNSWLTPLLVIGVMTHAVEVEELWEWAPAWPNHQIILIICFSFNTKYVSRIRLHHYWN